MAALDPKFATSDESLLLYAEMDKAAIRTVQRQLKTGHLVRILPGMVSASASDQWPALVARERLRVLAALFPRSVVRPEQFISP